MTGLVGVVLAGGRATRMGGGDKGRLMLGDQSLLAHVLARLAPQVAKIALNANGDRSRFDDLNLPVVPDTIQGQAGPLAGVLAGLDWAADQGADAMISVAADTPFFPSDLVDRLVQSTAGMQHPLGLCATPRGDDEQTRSMSRSGLVRHPTFGLWPVALRDDLRQALQDGLRKVVLWTDKHDGRLAEFPDPSAFFNVNTPDDLAHAESLL